MSNFPSSLGFAPEASQMDDAPHVNRSESQNTKLNEDALNASIRTTPFATRPCTHCGLTMTVPTSAVIDHPVFCCAGCRGAYELIHGWGLENFYALRDAMVLTGAAQSAGAQANYDQFDSAEFLGRSAPRLMPDGRMSSTLGVQGLHCAACSWLIEKALTMQSGVQASRIKMNDHTLHVQYDPRVVSLSKIAFLLDRLGYRLIPLDESRKEHLRFENRRLLIQIAIAGFLAANAMWIAIALYAGQFTGLAAEHQYFFGWVGILLGTAAVAFPGRTFFVGAIAALRTRTPHMDMPIALGLSVGTVAGLWHAILGRGPIYFDCLATLVFLLLIGRWIQFRQQHRAAQSVELMLRITPRHADLVHEGGRVSTVLVERLRPGDQIRVGAGEQVCADGQIVSGSSRLNRSLLTGESQPVSVQAGDWVDAGTVNIASPIVVRVSAAGADSRIGQVMQSVELAAAQRTPIVQLADRVGGVFVVVVMILAVITFMRWAPTSLYDATNYSTALLIVACPCALALATPLAIAVGIGRAARAQILIRDGTSLQRLSKPGMLWLDKTGTLTEGRQRASLIWGSAEALHLAAAVERQSQHPIAHSIVAAANPTNFGELPICEDSSNDRQIIGGGPANINIEALDVQASTGGIAGRVGNRMVQIGTADYLNGCGIVLRDELRRIADELLIQGDSPIFVAVNMVVEAVLGISDPVRSQAEEVVRQAKRLGWHVGILSGDHPEIVRRVGTLVGVDLHSCHGGVSPEGKLDAIRKSRQTYSTIVMVGDGANDAAALAAADVGISVRGGAEVSLMAAPIFMATNRLMDLVRLLNGSLTTTRVIYLNFGVSLLYNLATVYCALMGWISPLMAAVLMPVSSATVLGLTFLIPSFRGCSKERPPAIGLGMEVGDR